jgi:hypothetical protein
VKKLLWLPLLLTVSVRGDETADRTAIGRVIDALSAVPLVQAGLFTADSDAAAAVATLRTGGGMTVVISHQPWGEARLEPSKPSIRVAKTRFITPDVALVDGAISYPGGRDATPLLFVMKREGDSWKIAAIRMAQPQP